MFGERQLGLGRATFFGAVLVVSIILFPTVVAADSPAVWRAEVSDYREPLQSEALSLLGEFRRFIVSRAVPKGPPIGTTFLVRSSAYASSPYQTDATPCVTAAGTRVRPGVVATNFLPLGTILEINGERYIVEDRMNPRYQGQFVDLWFPSTSAALEHGRQQLTVTIVGYGTPGENVRAQPDAGEVVEPGFFERVQLRAQSFSGLVSRFVQTNVNQYDVDCFEDEVLETGN